MAAKSVPAAKKTTDGDSMQIIKWFMGIVVLLFIGFLIYQTSQSTSGTHGQLPGGDIPLKSINGNTITLNDFAGKVIILDFWATWCPPCKKEIPGYIRLYNRYRDQGAEIVGVTLQSGSLSDVRNFVQKFGINYPIVMGNNQIVAAYGSITGFPTTFVIDQKGKIVRRYEGYRPESVFEKDILQLTRHSN